MTLLTCLVGFCQSDTTNSILTTRAFRYGVYQTFAEFRDNRPSMTTGLEIKLDSTSEFLRYKLYTDKGKRMKYVYGFSDGHMVYVNAKVYNQNSYFVPILILGKIVYLEDGIARQKVINSSTFAMSFTFGLAGGVAMALTTSKDERTNPGWVIYMPDDDGNIYVLDKKTLGGILMQDDPELYKRFKKAKNQNVYPLLMDYIHEFNLNHPAKE